MKQIYISIFFLIFALTTNAQGNIAKESKQKMQDFFQKFSSPEQLKSATESAYALDSITFENGASKKMNYNSGGLLLTYKYYKNEADKINLYETETNTYNESGQMLTNVVGMYDDWAKKVIDQSKYENTYNALGRPVTEIEWDAGNDAPYALEYGSKTTYTYSDDKIEMREYDWDDDDWKLDMKQEMFVRWGSVTYPMVDSAYTYTPEEGTSDVWVKRVKMTVTYSGSLMSEIIAIGYDEDTGEERSKSKLKTTYNDIGNTLMETSEIYNSDSMRWDLMVKDEYEYNADNQIIREENYNVDWTTGLLAPISRNTYDYDSDGNLETQKEYLFYGTGDLTLSYKDDFTFKNLDTENIMLPSSDIGIFGNYTDFYDVEFYENGAIDEVEHYSYSYTDTETNEMLEKTGKYHYSEHNSSATSAKQLDNTSIKVFPNPFSNEIKLHLDKAEDYQLKIRNGIGQMVYSTTIYGTTTSHDVSDLPSGIYILSLAKEDKKAAAYKLIKE